MEKGGSFYNFVSKTINMPHIATTILKNLEPDDIANCLKANKIFRQFVSNALQWSKLLKNDLDDKVSRLVITNQHLESSKVGLLEKYAGKYNELGFGYDGTLWLFKTYPDPMERYLYPISEWKNLEESFATSVYDLQACKFVKQTKLQYSQYDRPRFKVSPSGSQILIQNFKKVMVFSANRNTKRYDNMDEVEHKGWGGVYPRLFEPEGAYFTVDPIFDCVGLDGGDFKLTVYQELGDCGLVGNAVQISYKPKSVLEKDRFLMVTASKCVTMFDKSSRKVMWHNPNLPAMKDCQEFLTETFCGFMYVDGKEMEDVDVYVLIGHFRLLILDNSTGQKIYHEPCWYFFKNSDIINFHLDYEPRVVASGNYLFACSIHLGLEDGYPDEKDNNSLLCVKVDPESKTCKVRKTAGGLETVVQAKGMIEEGKMGNCKEHYVEFCPTQWSVFGFASESVVIGQVAFSYGESGYCNSRPSIGSKTIFSVDLDKILDMYEPCAIFASVHFPLKENILDNREKFKWRRLNGLHYFPHYSKAAHDQVKLSGIVELYEEKGHLISNFHSLSKSFELKDLSGIADSHKKMKVVKNRKKNN